MRNCPNLLIKKGKELHLMNTRKAIVPGVNPVKFNSLEDYAEYVKWAKRVGIKCPILYYDKHTIHKMVRGYRLLDDPLCPKAGLPSNDFAPRQAPQQLLTMLIETILHIIKITVLDLMLKTNMLVQKLH